MCMLVVADRFYIKFACYAVADSQQATALHTLQSTIPAVIMAALRSRCGHYIFAPWFLSSFNLFPPPNLSRCRLDVYHTSTHGVALVRI